MVGMPPRLGPLKAQVVGVLADDKNRHVTVLTKGKLGPLERLVELLVYLVPAVAPVAGLRPSVVAQR